MKAQAGLACLPNIGPRERRRRMTLAGIAAAIAVITAAAVMRASAPGLWRLAIFPPTWAAVLCYLEARSRTCVVLAARGLRNLDAGNERVADDAARASAAQSRTIYAQSTIVAAIVVVGLWLVS